MIYRGWTTSFSTSYPPPNSIMGPILIFCDVSRSHASRKYYWSRLSTSPWQQNTHIKTVGFPSGSTYTGVALILIWSCVERTSNEVGYMIMSNWSIDLEQTSKPPRGRTCGHGSNTHHASQRAVASSIHDKNWLFCCEAHRYWNRCLCQSNQILKNLNLL